MADFKIHGIREEEGNLSTRQILIIINNRKNMHSNN